MTPTGRWSLDALMVHEAPMRLIDAVLEVDRTGMVATRRIREDSLFLHEGRVGAWVGIEFMAQTIGAWAGWCARQLGEVPRSGYLLGTRRYESRRPHFLVGEVLRIEIRERFQADNGLGQFECTLQIDGEEVATAALTVYQPQSGGESLGSGGGRDG